VGNHRTPSTEETSTSPRKTCNSPRNFNYQEHATDAAVAFGQDDDITVLTLTRLATGKSLKTAAHQGSIIVPA
jgi:hypothetical protein